MKLNKFVSWVTNLSMIMVLVITCCICLFEHHEDTRIPILPEVATLNENWNLNGELVTLPQGLAGKLNESVEITNVLPAEIADNTVLSMKASYCIIDCYVDGVKVGDFGRQNELLFGRMLGNVRVIFPISKEAANKEIKLVITPQYDYKFDITEMLFDHKEAIFRKVMTENVFRLLLVTFFGIITIGAIGLSIYQRKSVTFGNSKLFLHYAIFVMSINIWMICSSDLPQFFTNSNSAVSFLSFIALSMMVTPFMGFCAEIYETGWRVFQLIRSIGSFLPILIGLGYISGFAEPVELLPLTHGYIVVGVFASVYYAIREWKMNIDSRLLVIGIFSLIFSACTGLAFFAISPTSGLDGVGFGIGMLVFTTVLFILLVRKEVNMVEDAASLQVYKILAYQDNLTKIGNRAAFDDFFRTLEKEGVEGELITILMFDLNGLKKANDTMGHRMGDELIKGAAHCIRKIFKDRGICCRIGGDEFVVLMKNEPEIDGYMQEFWAYLEEYNKDRQWKISTAFGYATRGWDKTPEFRRRLFHEADEMMYENKNKSR